MEALPPGSEALQQRATAWEPASARVALNATLDACIVPSAADAGLRVDAGHVVVLDDLLDAASCASIRAWLGASGGAEPPPAERWERATADGPAQARTFGLRDGFMRRLEREPPDGVLELNSRLCKLYPECAIQHQFSAAGDGAAHVCERFVANAAVHGDSFAWHVDADPSALPPPLGGYVNRERGKPLFVSAILYIDEAWPENNDAETLFLDPPTGCGLFVRPKQGRVVLMDQDVTHRLSAPSATAGRPRYSLVWKLLFCPRSAEQRCCIARPEWGRPTPFGSAARVEQLSKQVLSRPPAPAVEAARAPAQKRRAEAPPMTEPSAKAGSRPACGAKRRSSRDAEPPENDLGVKRAALAPPGADAMDHDA